jgi:actin-related protein 5
MAAKKQKREANVKRLQDLHSKRQSDTGAALQSRLFELRNMFARAEEGSAQGKRAMRSAGFKAIELLAAEIVKLEGDVEQRAASEHAAAAAAAVEAARIAARPKTEDEVRREANLEQWLAETRAEHQQLTTQRNAMVKEKEALGNRRSDASKKRMRLLVQQANNVEDTFGQDEEDWNVYTKIGRSDGGFVPKDQARLAQLETQLQQHDPVLVAQRSRDREQHELQVAHQLRIDVERCRVPEILFQPSIIGSRVQGLSELLGNVLAPYAPTVQAQLASNVFVTGGNAAIPGLCERVEAEIRMHQPFQSVVAVHPATDPRLDAWRGASGFAASDQLAAALISRAEYDEHGPDYLKEHRCGNRYSRPLAAAAGGGGGVGAPSLLFGHTSPAPTPAPTTALATAPAPAPADFAAPVASA